MLREHVEFTLEGKFNRFLLACILLCVLLNYVRRLCEKVSVCLVCAMTNEHDLPFHFIIV